MTLSIRPVTSTSTSTASTSRSSDYRQPIYALPGNHDWYDGLNGFMFHFCGAQPLPPLVYRAGSYTWRERLAHALWRKPSPPKLRELLYERKARAQLQEEREDADWEPAQPAPYFAIETRGLLIVCIDTGVSGKLDREQGEWLLQISRDPRPKLLVTGKPIYVDGEYHPGEIDWGPDNYPGIKEQVGRFKTVDDIVREPAHGYLAAIGGDVHNYQRYSVLLNDTGAPPNEIASREQGPPPSEDTPPELLRRIEYVVSGGGGAYLSATHRFGRVHLDPADNPKRPEPSGCPRTSPRSPRTTSGATPCAAIRSRASPDGSCRATPLPLRRSGCCSRFWSGASSSASSTASMSAWTNSTTRWPRTRSGSSP